MGSVRLDTLCLSLFLSFFFLGLALVASVLRVDGACAFTDGTLFLAGSLAAWSAFAIAGVALDGAVSSAIGAVFHLGVFGRWSGRG